AVLILNEVVGKVGRQRLGDRQAEANRAARRFHIVLIELAGRTEDVEACRDALPQEVGFGEGEGEIARTLTATGRHADRLTAAEEVALGNGAFYGKPALCGGLTRGVARTQRELA